MSGKKSEPASDYTASTGQVMAHWEGPTEMTLDGVSFERLAEYPNPDVTSYDAGCLVVIDDNTFFLAGGTSGSDRAFIYTRGNDSWREVESMIAPREGHSCGIIKSQIGTGKDIVVAGGRTKANNTVTPNRSVEIFSVDTETWRQGNDLPNMGANSADEAYSIRYEDTFILVGDVGNQDTLLKYQPESDSWSELPDKLKLGRTEAVAILVNKEIFPCVNQREKGNKSDDLV